MIQDASGWKEFGPWNVNVQINGSSSPTSTALTVRMFCRSDSTKLDPVALREAIGNVLGQGFSGRVSGSLSDQIHETLFAECPPCPNCDKPHFRAGTCEHCGYGELGLG